jgi:hypothetical protein
VWEGHIREDNHTSGSHFSAHERYHHHAAIIRSFNTADNRRQVRFDPIPLLNEF